MTTATDQTLSPADLYRLIRSQIEFEDSLITQRLNWFLASQSFLVTAYAITLNAPVEGAIRHDAIAPQTLIHLIPLIALAVCILIYITVIAGILAQNHLRDLAAARLSQLADLPQIQGRPFTRLLGLSAPLGLPVIFAAVWIFLLFKGLLP